MCLIHQLVLHHWPCRPFSPEDQGAPKTQLSGLYHEEPWANMRYVGEANSTTAAASSYATAKYLECEPIAPGREESAEACKQHPASFFECDSVITSDITVSTV